MIVRIFLVMTEVNPLRILIDLLDTSFVVQLRWSHVAVIS